MKIPEKAKKLWARLPRRWRIVRNLAAAAALGVLAVYLLDWPCLSRYGAFQRLEGAFLLTPSRLVLQLEDGWSAGYLSEGDSWITVGSVSIFDDADKPLNLDRHHAVLHQVLPKEGIVAVLMPAKNEDNGAVIAVWGAPAEAVSGTLELDLIGIEDPFAGPGRDDRKPVQGLETFTAQARRREDGWFIFQFAPHENHRNPDACAIRLFPWWTFSPGDRLENNYQLTLFDVNGKQIAAQSGITPPDQMLMQW